MVKCIIFAAGGDMQAFLLFLVVVKFIIFAAGGDMQAFSLFLVVFKFFFCRRWGYAGIFTVFGSGEIHHFLLQVGICSHFYCFW